MNKFEKEKIDIENFHCLYSNSDKLEWYLHDINKCLLFKTKVTLSGVDLEFTLNCYLLLKKVKEKDLRRMSTEEKITYIYLFS